MSIQTLTHGRLQRNGPGHYTLSDPWIVGTLPEVTIRQLGRGKWIAQASWDRDLVSDPVATLREARRIAVRMLTENR
jgi:hypothetical protein